MKKERVISQTFLTVYSELGEAKLDSSGNTQVGCAYSLTKADFCKGKKNSRARKVKEIRKREIHVYMKREKNKEMWWKRMAVMKIDYCPKYLSFYIVTWTRDNLWTKSSFSNEFGTKNNFNRKNIYMGKYLILEWKLLQNFWT